MSEIDQNVLSLDELFGQADPVKVKWQGKMYNLRKVDAFNPKELNRWDHLQRKSEELENLEEEEMTDEQAETLEEVVYESVKMLNENLAEKTQFYHQVSILAFYGEKVKAETDELEKKRAKRLGLTGEPSSQS